MMESLIVVMTRQRAQLLKAATLLKSMNDEAASFDGEDNEEYVNAYDALMTVIATIEGNLELAKLSEGE